jgi:hypothetical protein
MTEQLEEAEDDRRIYSEVHRILVHGPPELRDHDCIRARVIATGEVEIIPVSVLENGTWLYDEVVSSNLLLILLFVILGIRLEE